MATSQDFSQRWLLHIVIFILFGPYVIIMINFISGMNTPQNPKNIFKPLRKNAYIGKRARDLPHWEQSGCTYFVTFRLFDALPKSELNALCEEKELWFKRHPELLSQNDVSEYEKDFFNKIQEWLDSGHGCCALKNPEVSIIVETALRYFDDKRYILDEFVIMPTHVHVIFKPLAFHKLSKILHSWKSFTANNINKTIGRTGSLWMCENFDHIIRTWEQLNTYRKYIRENPKKAGLRQNQYRIGRGKTPLQPENA